LLRESGKFTGEKFELEAVMGKSGGNVPFGLELVRFAEAVIAGGDDDLDAARRELAHSIGPAGLADTAAVAGLFNAIDRVADASGIPLEAEKAAATLDFRARLGIAKYQDLQR
jgi:hypothetical protein